MKRMKRLPVSCYILYLLLGFLSIGAVSGGLGLILDPSGGLMGLSMDTMKRIWFPNFLIPGILLLIFFGFVPLLVLYAMLRRQRGSRFARWNVFKECHASLSGALYLGFALLIWISVQTYILNTVNLVHLLYFAAGLSLQGLSLLPATRAYFRPE